MRMFGEINSGQKLASHDSFLLEGVMKRAPRNLISEVWTAFTSCVLRVLRESWGPWRMLWLRLNAGARWRLEPSWVWVLAKIPNAGANVALRTWAGRVLARSYAGARVLGRAPRDPCEGCRSDSVLEPTGVPANLTMLARPLEWQRSSEQRMKWDAASKVKREKARKLIDAQTRRAMKCWSRVRME